MIRSQVPVCIPRDATSSASLITFNSDNQLFLPLSLIKSCNGKWYIV